MRSGCLALLIGLNVAASASGDHHSAVELEFRVVAGREAAPVTSGTLWLFHYGWGSLDSLKLADIGVEPVRLVLTPEWRDSMIPPEPRTDACVVAFELPGAIWHRTADMPRNNLLRDFELFFWGLGSRVESQSGLPTLALPEHPLRVLRFLDLEGRARAGQPIKVSIYLTDKNHCGYHHGLRLGGFSTDEAGEIRLRAPLVDLYLDGMRYFEDEGDGPWGRKFSGCEGLRLGPSPVEIIRKRWELPLAEVSVTVVDAAGSPVQGILMGHCLRTSECGCNCGTAGETDARGVAHASLKPGETEQIWLSSARATENRERPLTDDEIRELFEKGILTIRLLAP